MRRAKTLVVVAALFLVGCGDPSDTSDAAGGASPDTPVSSTPQPDPSGPIKGGAQKVEPQPGMADVRPQIFHKVKVLNDRELRVVFYQGVPPCSVLDRVDVEYGAKTVGITLQVGRDETDEDTACIEIAVLNYVDVQLDEPLDGRKIVDGAA